VDAGKISREELYARAEELMKERLPKAVPAHKPAEPRVAAAAPAVAAAARPPAPSAAGGDSATP
jgi:hypothetical protein